MKTRLLRKVRRRYAIYRVDRRRNDTGDDDGSVFWDVFRKRLVDSVYYINNYRTPFYSIDEAKSVILSEVRQKYSHLGEKARRRKACLLREKVWYNS